MAPACATSAGAASYEPPGCEDLPLFSAAAPTVLLFPEFWPSPELLLSDLSTEITNMSGMPHHIIIFLQFKIRIIVQREEEDVMFVSLFY